MGKLNVAVTGASGFLGHHVLSALEHLPVEITAVTRDASNLAHTSPGLNIVEMDIASPEPDAFARLGSPDVLLHLAWDGLPNYDSPHHLESELPAQFNFLQNLVMAGLRSLVVTGTCFEYGLKSGPLSEEMETSPDNNYGKAKDSLRQQLESLKQTYDFSLTWARLFYMYGEHQAKSSLFPLLESAVASGEKSFKMSGGEQLRDYSSAADIGIKLAALAARQTDAGILNVCSGQPISVKDLVTGWLEQNNWQIKLELGHYPYSPFEPMEFWGDATKLDSFLPTPGST